MKFTAQGTTKAFLFAALSLALAGCPPKKPMNPAEAEAPVETLPADNAAMEALAPALEIGTEWATAPALAPVYFDSNRADLKPESRATLKRNAEILKAIAKAAKGVQVRVEGHCDNRGTVEYNLALAQRRASSAKTYYTSLGIKGLTFTTVSYGEEKPSCFEENESCWWRNRRGETALKASAPIRVPLDQLPAAQP